MTAPALTDDAPLLDLQLGALSEAQREQFLAASAQREAATAVMMRLAAGAIDSAPWAEKEFVGDELACLLNVHPLTGRAFATQSSLACDFPRLMAEMDAGHLGERHVRAAVDALHACLSAQPDRVRVLDQVLEQCRAKVTAGRDWPRPGELDRMIRAMALLLDLHAAEDRREKTVQDRGVFPTLLPDGAACAAITGPAEQVSVMLDAIRAYAEALGRIPGDERSLEQRQYDAAYALLTAQAEGGELPSGVTIRPTEAQILVPFSTATGGDLELADLPGYGPLLPSTARTMLTPGTPVRRVCVDAETGRVLAVDDAQPFSPDTLARMATDPVKLPDLGTNAYRPGVRLTRPIRLRDRTCQFPGCTTQARWCDLDHRNPWRRGGPTAEHNLHCLCRHHHRAKQLYFTVTVDHDGTTVWTTKDGHQYRRPPPGF